MELIFSFLLSRSKNLMIGIFSILGGIVLWIVLNAYSGDYSSTEIMICRIIGGILVLAGIAILVLHIIRKRSQELDFTEKPYKLSKKDVHPHSRITRSYLQEITRFFTSQKITENMPIQKYVTQTYKNILDLHKKRLDRCQVQLQWQSVPQNYTDTCFKENKYFDGKYEITEINQQIESKRRYSRDDHTLLIRRDKELAHYTIINAKKTGDNQIICPNCGCLTSRENLIDGCDYCGTRFTVEDLGEKISDFTLRDDADLAYEKFKDKRLDRGYYAFLLFFWAFFAFILFCLLVAMVYDPGSGDPTNPLFLTFSCIGISLCFAYLMALCCMVGYIFIIFPVTEILRNAWYHSKKRAETLRDHEQEEKSIQRKIRESDPLFSLAGFYSNIQNKLSTIFYAETREQFLAFSEEDLSKYHGMYQNIIDYDISDMYLKEYHIENGLQIADLETQVDFFELTSSSKKIRPKKQAIKIRVIKSASSKTKAVTTPYIISCPNCGNSLSLLNGMICEHCGTKPDLKEYDWTIQKFDLA